MRGGGGGGVAAGSCEGDFMLLLNLEELQSMVGDAAWMEISSALETDALGCTSDCKCRLHQRAIDVAACVTAKQRVGCVFLLKLCLIF